MRYVAPEAKLVELALSNIVMASGDAPAGPTCSMKEWCDSMGMDIGSDG